MWPGTARAYSRLTLFNPFVEPKMISFAAAVVLSQLAAPSLVPASAPTQAPHLSAERSAPAYPDGRGWMIATPIAGAAVAAAAGMLVSSGNSQPGALAGAVVGAAAGAGLGLLAGYFASQGSTAAKAASITLYALSSGLLTVGVGTAAFFATAIALWMNGLATR